MLAQVTALRYWKSEHHDESTCEDAYKYNIARGLFAVSDGAGTTSFSDIWARILVNHFLDIPLTSDKPFEVEWWARLAQREYAGQVPRPETLPWPAQQKAREGSQATLVAMRITDADSFPIQANLLAFGDSCIFVRSTKEHDQLKSFPLAHLSDFDAPPICVPSLARVFNRHYHKCKIISTELYPDDIVILATDAVAKWILSKGVQGFQTILEQNDESWPAFIKTCRANGEMVDDDSTVVIVKLSIQPGFGEKLQAPPPHSTQVIQARKRAFEDAFTTANTEMVAIYYGDGDDLGLLVSVPWEKIERARNVADALQEMIQAIRNHINDPHFATKVGPLWQKHRDLLQEESCAKHIRETLAQKGVDVSISAPMPTPPAPDTTKSIVPIDPPVPPPVSIESPPPDGPPEPVGVGEVVASETTDANSPLPDTNSDAERDRLEQEQKGRTVIAQPRSQVPIPLETRDAPLEILTELEKAFQSRNSSQFSQSLAKIRKSLEQATIVYRFAKAYFSEDDQGIAEAYDDLQKHNPPLITYIPEHRIDLARKRKLAKAKFQIAQKNRKAREIVRDYEDILDGSSLISDEERSQLELAREFVNAYAANDDDGIIKVRQKIVSNAYSNILRPTPEEEERYSLAVRRQKALQNFREKLKTGSFIRIVEAYHHILDGYLQHEEIVRLRLAILLFESYKARDYERFVDANDDATALIGSFFILTEEQEKFYEEGLHKPVEPPKPSTRMALVNRKPITIEMFWKVYALRKSYLRFRSSVLKEVKKATKDKQSVIEIMAEIDRLSKEALQETTAFCQTTLEELVNDALIQAYANPRLIDASSELESKLNNEIQHFTTHYAGSVYEAFLSKYGLQKKDLEDILRVFLRRQLMEEDCRQRSLSLDDWLKNSKSQAQIKRYPERIKIISPPPELQEPEQKRRFGW